MVPVWTPQANVEQSAPVSQLSSSSAPWQPSETPRYQKLSSKASAFQPSLPAPKAKADNNGQVSDMVKAAKSLILERGQNITSVDVTQDAKGWSIVISPDRRIQVHMDRVLALAKEALLIAAEKSNNVYVLGYGDPENAFTAKPQGFEARLAVMAGMQTPCWRILKKGVCKHEGDCYKQHPTLQVPVEVFVETTQFAAPPQIVQYFKQEAANIMMMVVAMLTNAACGAGAQAITDEDGQGWRIEIYVRDEDMLVKDHILSLAQNALTEAAQQSKLVYIMGSGATPFHAKSLGFSTTLGEMQDKSKACWDVYMQGACWRQHSCRWQHPQCLMPVDVTLKALSPS